MSSYTSPPFCDFRRVWLFVSLALGMSSCSVMAQGNTSLDSLVRSFDFTLTAYTNAPFVTNGIVASTKSGAFTISSKDLIRALSGLPAQRIEKNFTTFQMLITNSVPGPDIVITQDVTVATPAYTDVIPSAYSPRARLLYFEPVSTNSFSIPQFVVRDLGVDYVVSSYFLMDRPDFNQSPEAVTLSGRHDIVHDLTSASVASIARFGFDVSRFSEMRTGLYFEVQGFTTESVYSPIKDGVILDHQTVRSLSADVAGSGQLPDGTFCLVKGRIRSNPMKLESR